MNPTTLFLIFSAVAFLLFVMEVFVPGGVLGITGGISLLAACGFAVAAFGAKYGSLTALLMILATLCGFMLWLMKMPESRIGKRFSLQAAITEKEPSDTMTMKLGTRGTAETDLRPGGFARFDGKKMDVVASSGYIEQGTALEITELHGSHLVVRPLSEETTI